MFPRSRIGLVDSPENAENIREGFLHQSSLRKGLVARATTIDIIEEVLPLEAPTGSGKKV